MDLTLANGWTRTEPQATHLTLLLSGQTPGQRLVATDTAFAPYRDLAFSGGSNCPLAVDHTAARVFFPGDFLASADLATGDLQDHPCRTDLAPVWLLDHRSDRHDLIMLLHGPDPKARCLGVFDPATGGLQTLPLPDEVFEPLATDHDHGVALFSTRTGGAALCDLAGSDSPLASVHLRHSVKGGCFDGSHTLVILGGSGLTGWNIRTGQVTTLCQTGRYPVRDRKGDIWLCTEDGNLSRLHRDGSGFDVIVELAGIDPRGWGYAQPIVFSPDGRYGVARLTGLTPQTGQDLAEAEAFCRQHGMLLDEVHRNRFDHMLCILDLDRQKVWCNDGYAHNLAWVAGPYAG